MVLLQSSNTREDKTDWKMGGSCMVGSSSFNYETGKAWLIYRIGVLEYLRHQSDFKRLACELE